jgi:Tfp pilus assembly protein PilF
MNGVWKRARAALVLTLLAGCSAGGSRPPAQSKPTSTKAAKQPASEPQGPGGAEMSPEAARLYAAGLESFGKADLKTATTQFEQAVALDRRSHQALAGLAVVLERRGQIDRALEAYRAALALAPDYPPALSGAVRMLLAADRVGDAAVVAHSAAAKAPDSAAVLTARAEVSSARGDSTTAQQLAQKALKRDPDYRPAMLTLARDHYRARRLDLALYTLKAILDGYGEENPPRDKDNPDAHVLRALIYGERGRRKAAMEELDAALAARPDLIEARLLLSAYMLEAGNAVEARPILEKALEYDPSNVLVHLNLGDAYRLLGKPKDALDHLQWVSRRDETLAKVHYNIGLVYLLSAPVPGVSEKEAIELAIRSFERFRKLAPRAARGEGDDVEDLLARARNKKAILEALEPPPAEEGAAEGAPAEGAPAEGVTAEGARSGEAPTQPAAGEQAAGQPPEQPAPEQPAPEQPPSQQPPSQQP